MCKREDKDVSITMEDIMNIDKEVISILKMFKDNHYQYLVRNKDGRVFVSVYRPKKGDIEWYSGNTIEEFMLELTGLEEDGFYFPCKWEQTEPIKLKDLLSIRPFYAIHKPNRLLVRKAIEGEVLHTLNGDVTANKGDYVITGVNGEQYPCDPEIFKKLYDVVD